MDLPCKRFANLLSATMFIVICVAMFAASHALVLEYRDTNFQLNREKRHADTAEEYESEQDQEEGDEDEYEVSEGDDTEYVNEEENYEGYDDDEENEVGNPESWIKILNITMFCDSENENSEPAMQTAGQNPIYFGFLPSCDDFVQPNQDRLFIPFKNGKFIVVTGKQKLPPPPSSASIDSWYDFLNQQGNIGSDLSNILDMIYRIQYNGAFNQNPNAFAENGDKISQLRSVLSFALLDSHFSTTTETPSTYTTSANTNGNEGAWGVPDNEPTTTVDYNGVFLNKLALDLGLL
ncbi:Hypothetical predicted protein [Cloeon dipterum]|uniref:Uncharacterized protein n=1 Tax=Cloeon dipterum TaxID=197152 RepID=A0A8S1CL63_9INSE|nr:Hypothetical predicted protein [Cloeon dipterum]